jgi:DNA polymerase-1
VFGYSFVSCEREDSKAVEGYDRNNVRRIFLPRPDHYCVSIDYAAQELKIAGNVSGDRAFIDPFLNGVDLHEDTAIKMFGRTDKALRKLAKVANFALLYLGNDYTLRKSIPEKSDLERLEIYEAWCKVHSGWLSYVDSRYNAACKTGYIVAPSGRIRRIGYWASSYDRGDNNFAKRTVSNDLIQGSAGDIMRIALIRLYTDVLTNQRYEGKVFFMSSVHDELDLSITKEPNMFTEIVDKVCEIMVDVPFAKDWEVPLTVEPSVGINWGHQLSMYKNEKGLYIPGKKEKKT